MKNIADDSMVLSNKFLVLESMKPFQSFFFNCCMYSSIFTIVEYFGGDILPFLVNGIGCYMFYNTQERCSAYIRFHQVEDPINILERVGIDIDCKDISYDLCQDIISQIQMKRPVIIPIDCFDESIRPEFYMKKHVPHYLVIYGYDLEQKIFHIIEQNITEDIRYFKRIITFTDIKNAYQGYLKQFHKKEYTFWAFSQGKPQIQEDLDSIYRRNIRKFLPAIMAGLQEKEMFCTRFLELSKNADNLLCFVEDIIWGLNDIIKFIESKIYMLSRLQNQTVPLELLKQLHEEWKVARTILAKFLYSQKLSDSKLQKVRNVLPSTYQIEQKLLAYYK